MVREKWLAAVLATGVFGVLATAVQAQTPRFDLVGKNPFSAYSVVQAVTDDGRAGGFNYSSRGFPTRSFGWTPEGGRLDYNTSIDGALATAVFARDLGHYAATSLGAFEAYRHTFNGQTDTIMPNFGEIQARAISADGRFIVGAQGDVGELSRPFIWSPETGTRALPARPGHDSEAFGVSDDGRFVAGWDFANDVGWVWNDAVGYTLLPNAIDGAASGTFAVAVSNDGRTALGLAGAEYAPGQFAGVPTRWIDGVPQPLGLLPGFTGGYASGMSADGSVIVGELYLPIAGTQSFVWTSASGIQLLTEHLQRSGLSFASGTVIERAVVSRNGDVFGGDAFSLQEPNSGGFVAVIPAPSTPLLILALAPLAARRRRSDTRSRVSCP